MESLTVNVLSKGLTLPTLRAYQKLRPEQQPIQFTCSEQGKFDVCVIIDDVPSQKVDITAKQFLFFGSETIYPVDHFDSVSARQFLNQFDEIYGPYPYSNIGEAALPALPFMYDDNHGSISKPNREIATRTISSSKQLGFYTVISNKCITELQYVRLKLYEYLDTKMGSSFHLYGNGFNPITSKINIGHKFTHSLAIENRRNPFIISEKFFDPIILRNELFYLGGNIQDIQYTDYITDISADSFDSIYAKASDALSNYKTDSDKDHRLSTAALMALEDNFISRISDVVLGKSSGYDFKLRTLWPHSHFKKHNLYKNPVQFLKWKYRGNFL